MSRAVPCSRTRAGARRRVRVPAGVAAGVVLGGLLVACSSGATTTAPTTTPAGTALTTTAAAPGSSSTAAATTAATTSMAVPATPPISTAPSHRPNILFVLTDDMRLDDLQYMPQVRSLVGAAGVTFDDYFDNVTLCCPARTSILRGQYSHNTRVLTNQPPNGGFQTAHANGDEAATIATALHAAGYTTGLFGKYLNGYPAGADATYVPPGWDAWASSTAGNAYGEYDYTLNENGRQVVYGHSPADYGTDVYVGLAEDFISSAARAGTPFFVYLAVYAPHQPATPAPQDVGTFADLSAPRDPSFNEADVSDKPAYVQGLPLLGPTRQTVIDNLYRRRIRSLQAVDRGVAALVERLRQTGQLDDTYIVFTSDNGFHLGQHRLPAGKQTAYETDIHLPLLVRGPGLAGGGHVAALAGDIDLAPTIADLAGTTMADDPDGRSLAPLLRAATAGTTERAPSAWRQVYLLEHWRAGSTVPQPGSSQLEPDDLDQADTVATDSTTGDPATPSTTVAPGRGVGIPEYAGLRTARYTYVEYVTGERELYDLTTDPDELDNLAATAPAALLAELHTRLQALRTCAGAACRAAEDQPLSAVAS